MKYFDVTSLLSWVSMLWEKILLSNRLEIKLIVSLWLFHSVNFSLFGSRTSTTVISTCCSFFPSCILCGKLSLSVLSDPAKVHFQPTLSSVYMPISIYMARALLWCTLQPMFLSAILFAPPFYQTADPKNDPIFLFARTPKTVQCHE